MKLLTTVQIVLEIAHDEDFAPADVARVAADVARDAITWTDNLELNRAIEGVEDPVRVVSAIVIASPPLCEVSPGVLRYPVSVPPRAL